MATSVDINYVFFFLVIYMCGSLIFYKNNNTLNVIEYYNT